VPGVKFQVINADSQCTPLPAANAANKLIKEDNVDIILGESCSSATIAIKDIVGREKVPLMNAGSSSIKITEEGNPYTFRIMPNEVMQNSFLAEKAVTDLKLKKFVTAHETTDSGIGNNKAFVDRVTQLGGTVLDFSTSLRFHYRHLPGAWWVVRSRLAEAHARIGAEPRMLILTSEDGVLAHLAAPDVAALWPYAKVRVLEGGNAAWKGSWESGHERATTTRDDVWYKPYDHDADYEKHARDYLAWEVALIEQIKRDPTIRFAIPY
jgi:hypothetical protein